MADIGGRLDATKLSTRPLFKAELLIKVLLVALISAGVTYGAGTLARTSPPVQRGVGDIHDTAETAIMIGGILMERNRHVVVGGLMGCVVGGALGAGAAALTGVFTAGLGFAAIPAASAAGCAALGFAGGAVGWPLDDYLDL